MEFLHRGSHTRHLAEILEPFRRLRALGEGPQVGEFGAGDAAAAVGYPEYNVLLGLADGDFDGRRDRGHGVWLFLVSLDDGLHGVAEELADNVLDVAENVGEAGVEVAHDVDLRDGHVRTVGGAGERGDSFGAPRDDIPGGALDEDFAYEVGFGEFCSRREVGRVEGFG